MFMFEAAKEFNAFLFIVQAKKTFGFFVPHKFEQGDQIRTSKQLAFYWINDDSFNGLEE